MTQNTDFNPIITTQLKTDLKGQKGVDITIESEVSSAKLNIWCDTVESDDPRIIVTLDNDKELLMACVDNAEFVLPTIGESTNGDRTTITFNTVTVILVFHTEFLSIHIAEFVGTEKSEVITNNSFRWADVFSATTADT